LTRKEGRKEQDATNDKRPNFTSFTRPTAKRKNWNLELSVALTEITAIIGVGVMTDDSYSSIDWQGRAVRATS
jgi:hypothetical protein